ncbi:MAG: hypothetical protein WDN26_10535 [Chitinophagaceae bacterium]
MKKIPRLSWVFTALLFCTISASSFSQALKDVFSNSESPIVYLGIDFSKARLLDQGNPDDIRNKLYNSINQLIINEPKKYDLKGAFHKGNIDHDLSAVTAKNDKANINDIISTNSSDFNRFKESDISSMVRELNLSGKKGVGLVFVMEAMRKLDKKGDAAIWVTFVDMGTKKVLMTERIESSASMAIGFRNYWASTIKKLIDLIDSRKYDEWKQKYVK